MSSTEERTAPQKRERRIDFRLAGALLLVAVLAAGWGVLRARQSDRALARTENALQLQVLGSRLGVAAFEAEYGDYPTALEVASEAFEGIANYGIEQGALPRDYAQVLAQRDQVVAMLATREEGVAERLMALFFGLQIPVDIELDPTHLLPAADSGLGLEPPRRVFPPGSAADSVPAHMGMPRDSAIDLDTLPPARRDH